MKFEGLTAADFDAYEEKKWQSNRFNLERMRTREKLVGLLARVMPSEEDTAHLEIGWSHDHPTVFNHKKVSSQWCYRLRNEETRKLLSGSLTRSSTIKEQVEDPALHHLHALLGMEINLDGLRVGLSVHQNASVDLENWNRITENTEAFSNVVEHLSSLADNLEVMLGTERSPKETWSQWTAKDWRERIALMSEGKESWLHLAIWIPRDEALAWTEGQWDELQEGLVPLARLHQQIQWAEDNDLLNLKAAIAEERAARVAAAEAAELARKEAKTSASNSESKEEHHGPVSVLGDWRKTRSARTQPRENDSREKGPRHQRDEESSKRDEKKRRHSRSGSQERTRPRNHGDKRDNRSRDGGKKRDKNQFKGNRQGSNRKPRVEKKWVVATGEITVGSRVRMSEGLLAGRDGEVVELGSKGDAKVLVGQFPTRVPLKSLTLLQEG